MAVLINDIINKTNQFIRDTSTNSVSQNDRFRAITEATKQLYNEGDFDFQNKTFTLNYYDSVNFYDITTDVPDFLEPVDLRIEDETEHLSQFTRKSPREVAVEINNYEQNAFSVERRDRKVWLGISHISKHPKVLVHGCDSTASLGTVTVDATNSDGTALTVDTVEFKEGTGSFNFDVDVSQSGNNRATIEFALTTARDLSAHENLSSLVFWVFLPEVTNFSSITGYIGSSSSAYWSASVTTDMYGASFAAGWNRIKIDWEDMTKTGSPDATAIDYLRFDFNYTASQADDTDFRIDDIIMVRPEKLKLHFQTWYVGLTSSSTAMGITEFTSTSNVLFFSGVYDHFDVYVAHQAAAILFRQMGLTNDAATEEGIAAREIQRLKKKFPYTKLTPTKNFKSQGLRWSHRGGGRTKWNSRDKWN